MRLPLGAGPFRSLSRFLSVSIGLALGGTFASPPARAQAAEPTTKEACFSAHVEAQEARQSGKLLTARSKLHICGASHCPAAVQTDCVQWANEVAKSIPTIVLEADDEVRVGAFRQFHERGGNEALLDALTDLEADAVMRGWLAEHLRLALG